MTLAVAKKTLLKCWIWTRQHWRWLVFSIAILAAYLAGRRNNRALILQANLAKKQYQKEAASIERQHKIAEQKKVEVEQKYKKSIAALDKHYLSANSKLEREKDKEYKKQLKAARKDPEKLNALLQELGIEEV